MGYYRAGFDVVGIDINPMPSYPYEFHQGDALELIHELIATGDFAAIHASPPCQAHTTMSNRWRGKGGLADERTNLIPQTRDLLEESGLPWVIENVVGAKAWMRSTVVINGASVGLPRLDRPRLFETNWLLLVPERVAPIDPVGVYGSRPDGRLLAKRANGTEQRAATSVLEGGTAMGIDWLDWPELKEAVPPAYCELIGHQLMTLVGRRVGLGNTTT